MDIKIIIALALAIPVILFPAAFVWYMNISGILQVAKNRVRKAAKKRVTVKT